VSVQDTKSEESDDHNLLSRMKVEVSDWHNRQDKDSDVDEAMHQYSPEKESGLVDRAFCTSHCLIPEGLDGYAMEDGQEDSHNKPDDGHSGKDQDGNPDVRCLEQSPIEGQDSQLRGRNREGV
jgi:hypothetical protein